MIDSPNLRSCGADMSAPDGSPNSGRFCCASAIGEIASATASMALMERFAEGKSR